MSAQTAHAPRRESDSSPRRTQVSRRLPLAVVICAVLTLVVAEMIALNRFAVREVTWGFPIAFDQCSYGLQSFELYEEMGSCGTWSVVLHQVNHSSAQGFLLQIQAALLSRVFGPGWLLLLNVNFLYYLLLQAATALAAWHVSEGSWRWVLMSLGLILTLGTP